MYYYLNENASETFYNYHRQWKLQNVLWMAQFLDSKILFEKEEYQDSLFSSTALKRELNLKPGLYPASFRLSLHLLILENLWYLKKFKLIERYSRKLLHLDRFPAYQRIPVLQYFLSYFLWIRKFDMIELIMSDLNSDMAYGHFNSFQARARLIELSSYFVKGDFRKCLSYLNRENRLNYLDCQYSEFDMRSIELLCLLELEEDLLFQDKMESLRRFISRSEALKEDSYVSSFISVLRKNKVLESQELKIYHELMAKRSVFDIRWIIIQSIVQRYSPDNFVHFGKYSSQYNHKTMHLSMAAENGEKFRKIGE